jgi:peptide-methionine (S)-S-oxide reductase
VTEVTTLPRFYPAEAYHQNYATLHPNDPYIRLNDAPKLERLKTVFPGLYFR